MNIKGAGLSARNRTIFRLPTGQSMSSSSFRRTIVRRDRQTRPFFVLFFSGCGKCPRGHAISIDGFSHLASNNQHQDGDGTQLQPYHSWLATAARERAYDTECLWPPSARQGRQHDPDAEKLFDQRRLPIARVSPDWSAAPQWPIITVNSQPFATTASQ